MDNPKSYLLKKIIGHKENGLSSLGELHAKHIDDLSQVMLDFVDETFKEVADRLNAGETIDLNGKVYSLISKKKKK